ncbi:hypothetical protein CAPTEDRAFT_185861, partial [Capitella teleta]
MAENLETTEREKSFSLTWNTMNPDFSHCFQDTVLTWIPCALLLLGSIPYSLYLRSRLVFHNQRSTQNWVSIVFGSIIALVSLLRAILGAAKQSDHNSMTKAFVLAQVILCFSVVIATCLTAAAYRRGVHSSGLLSLFYALLLLDSIISFRSNILQYKYE